MSQDVSRCLKAIRKYEVGKTVGHSQCTSCLLHQQSSEVVSRCPWFRSDCQEECFQSRIVPWKYIERPAPHFWGFFQLWKGLNAAAVAITCLLNPVLRFPLGHWGTNTAFESFTSPDLGHSIAAKVSENTMTSNHLIPSCGQQKPYTIVGDAANTIVAPSFGTADEPSLKGNDSIKAIGFKTVWKEEFRLQRHLNPFESFWILLAPIHCWHCGFNWSQTKKDKQESGKIYVLFQRKEKLDLFTISIFQ